MVEAGSRRWRVLLAGRALVVLVGVLVGVLVALPGSLVASPAAADEGPWTWPLAGPHEVSRPFAPPATAYGAGHRGADLPAAPGALVRAAAAGRVSYAGLLAGRGVVVVVHGALRTTYEPVTALVEVGSEVAGGEPLGLLEHGHAGCPAPACLHWGLRRGEAYLDPVRLVQRGPVRLLPADGARGAVAGADGPAGLAAGVTQPPAGAGPAGLGGLAGQGGLARPGWAGAPRADAGPGKAGGREPAARVPSAQAATGWSLRGADLPLGTTAVVALVLGIGLLTRPRPGPEDPPAASSSAAVPVPAEPALPDGPVAPVLALDAERLRRRAG